MNLAAFEDEPPERFRRDRAGETFQSDLTEEDLPPPPRREEADHALRGDPDVDSQAGDEFMQEHKFPPSTEPPDR